MTTFLTPEEAAEHLGIPESRMKQWRSDRRGPAYVKEGQTILYTIEDLEAWAARQRIVPTRTERPALASAQQLRRPGLKAVR